MKALRLLATLGFVLFCGGCGPKPEDQSMVNIFIWSDYLTKDVLTEFTAKTGIKVNFDTYDSNEALLSKLKSGLAEYDVIVPSDYMVRIMIAEKLLTNLDRSKLENFKNLDEKFLNQKFDPNNEYSVPFLWGTTGIGYNKEKIHDKIDSWSVLFEPKYKGQILMLNDVRECFAVALKMMGKSLNEKDPEALKKAAQMLKDQKSLVKTYNSDDFSNILASGDVNIAHGYNGQIAKIVNKNPDKFNYIIPKEGGTFWMDNLCIPKSAKHPTTAYAFLNYLLDGKTAAATVNFVCYASANAAAKEFIKPVILNDPMIYPPEEVTSKCEFIEDVGETMVTLDQYWTEIKAK